MKKPLYGTRDYAFAQLMLTLRTRIGLTQAGLAEVLGISRRAVAQWEAGSSYPKAHFLRQVITLGNEQQVFPAGHAEEEIRALWKAAHQKVLLDEVWLQEVLSQQTPPSEHFEAELARTASTNISLWTVPYARNPHFT